MSDNQEKLQVEVVEEAPAPVEEAPAPVEEAPAPVKEAVAPEAAEVVKNVKEMLSSTEGKSGGDLENRVKVLEERLDKFYNVFCRKFNIR